MNPASFTRLALANFAAQCAEQLSLAAVPLVAVMSLGSGPGEIGFLVALQTLPFLIFSIPVGLLADRLPRRTLMVTAETIRATSLLALLVLLYVRGLSIPALGLLGFVGALGTVAFSVATPAVLPALVPRESLGRANGRIELARSVAFSAGPPLAGAVVGSVGGGAVFVLATILSCMAVALLLRIAEPPRTPAPARNAWRDIYEGGRFVWGHEHLRPMLLTGFAWNVSWFVLQAAYVSYAIRSLGLSSELVGLSLGCFGGGMMVGALLAPWIVSRIPFGRAIQLGPAVSVAAAAAMTLTLKLPSGLLAGLSFFLFGAGPIVWVITTSTLRQSVTPAGMLGRVGAVFLTVNSGARPLGAALGAAVGTAWGCEACLVLAFVGFGVQALIIINSPVEGLRRLPAEAGSSS